MLYRFYDELKMLRVTEAIEIYSRANECFMAKEKSLHDKLLLLMIAFQVFGGWLGVYFYNSTHILIYTGFIGVLIGFSYSKGCNA